MYHLQNDWPRFNLPNSAAIALCHNIVKFSNRPIENLLSFLQQTSMDFCKV